VTLKNPPSKWNRNASNNKVWSPNRNPLNVNAGLTRKDGVRLKSNNASKN
jgi:hypothetical protein